MAEQRYQAVLAVISDGETVTEVAARFGVSRQTVHDWLAKYEAGGLENLGDRSHRPRSCPHQMGSEVEVAIARMRTAHPAWGPRRIAFELGRGHSEAGPGADLRADLGPVPSESGVYRALVRLNLIDPGGRRRRDRKWKRSRSVNHQPKPNRGTGHSAHLRGISTQHHRPRSTICDGSAAEVTIHDGSATCSPERHFCNSLLFSLQSHECSIFLHTPVQSLADNSVTDKETRRNAHSDFFPSTYPSAAGAAPSPWPVSWEPWCSRARPPRRRRSRRTGRRRRPT